MRTLPLLAVLILCSPAVFADDSDPEEEAEQEEAAPAPAAAPAGHQLGGAGLSTARPATRHRAAFGKRSTPAGGSGSATPLDREQTPSSGEADELETPHQNLAQNKDIAHGDVYDSFREMPRTGGHGSLKFRGPGHGISVRFRPHKGADGRWSIVEDPRNNTNLCGFIFFVSRTPGGKAVSPTCDKRASGTGNAIKWNTAKPPDNDMRHRDMCVLPPDKDYYINIGLIHWEPNPHANNARGCDMFLDPPHYYHVQGNENK